MLTCPIAATPPSMVEASAQKATICRHSAVAGPIAPSATRISSAIAATFGAEAKKAVTGVGEPS